MSFPETMVLIMISFIAGLVAGGLVFSRRDEKPRGVQPPTWDLRTYREVDSSRIYDSSWQRVSNFEDLPLELWKNTSGGQTVVRITDPGRGPVNQ